MTETCVNGHVRDDETTYVAPSGERKCRRCRAENSARYRRERPSVEVRCTSCGKPRRLRPGHAPKDVCLSCANRAAGQLREREPLEPRIHEKYVVDAAGCWTWTAACDPCGYGQIKVDGKMRGAHVAMYELLVGPIPDGLELDHLCRVRHCVNPEHLEPVTHLENVRRARLAREEATR